MDLGLKNAMLAALGIAAFILLGYQAYMLHWTKKVAGEVPAAVKVIRTVNIVLIVAVGAMVVWQLAR